MSKGLNQNREVSYCNTCTSFPLDDAATPGGPNPGQAQCEVRRQLYAWDSRACMFYAQVGEVERARRSHIVVELFNRGKEPASAEAKDAPKAGK